MTANGFMSVSLEPPLVVVSVARTARLHEVLRRAGRFGVTLLGDDLEETALAFAGRPPAPGTDPPRFADRAGAPVLLGGLAWMAGEIDAAHDAGDHTLFLMAVSEMDLERPEQPPLAFHRSAFALVRPIPRAATIDAWSGSSSDWWG